MPRHDDLKVIVGDLRQLDHLTDALRQQDAVIHLAALSNTESAEIDPAVSEVINVTATRSLLDAAYRAGVRRFIYASTSAVYGPSDAPEVTEDTPLRPQWRYAIQKAACEPFVLARSSDGFACTVVRPAALCGYSPRPRLDLTVNILTTHAVVNRKIEVWGGAQERCSLHVSDMADAYAALLDAPVDDVAGQVFNVGQDNHTVLSLAAIVQGVVSVPIEILPARGTTESYRIMSTKMAQVVGWRPSRTIADAVKDLVAAFEAGLLPDPFGDERYYNTRVAQRLFAAR